MSEYKFHPKLIIGILLTISFGIALYFRVSLPYDQVFGSEWIKFTSIDAYYHMRIVDNLVHNFPHLYIFDPYFIYPGGGWLDRVHFFDWLLAGIIWVVGLGSPTQHTTDVAGVYFPAILGALVVVPVYFIGKELFNRWVGVLAAFLIAIAPGEYIGRSILGFADHHVAETVFSTVTILFLIMAIKVAGQKRLTFNHLRQRDWATCTGPLVYMLLTGISLGIYLITWGGGLLFVFVFSVYLVVQFIIDHLRQRPAEYLCIAGVSLFLVAMIVVMPFSPHIYLLVSLFIALLIPFVLSGVSWLMARKQLKPAYYPVILLGIGLLGLGIFYVINPSLVGSVLGQFSVFTPKGAELATMEAQPLLFPGGNLSISTAWGIFTTGFFFVFISLGILLYLVIKQGAADKTLLLVWSVVLLAATLGQRRFAYYFAVNVAVLVGYLSWQTLWFAGLRKLLARPMAETEGLKPKGARTAPKRKYKARSRLTIIHLNTVLAIIVIFLFVFFPNIKPAIAVSRQARFTLTDAWYGALSWMKGNTPDPFGDTDFYYELYETPLQGESYDYPESVYGVTAWWDYGYWITRIAHRLPSSNPGQTPQPIINTANLFLSQEELPAQQIITDLDSAYIILDNLTTTTKFWAVVTWAGRELSDFIDVYHLVQKDNTIPVQIFTPEYYRSISVRLYNFDGKAVTTVKPVVLSYQEKVDSRGTQYKQITNAQEFSTYEEALSYIENQKSGKHSIVGVNPFVSPVPLEAIKSYKLVYSSDDSIKQAEALMVPEVKIFKYVE
ncbi:oligosaccharyl transferase, archaeosortase A system-associated [Chloroflexota bacterium]